MIIIKIIILYFIQIRHTDDFPSTGTRLVHIISPHVTIQVCIHYSGTYTIENTPERSYKCELLIMYRLF